MKKNLELRELARRKNIKLWEIADKLNIKDSNFSRMLRYELQQDMKDKISKVIRELEREKSGR